MGRDTDLLNAISSLARCLSDHALEQFCQKLETLSTPATEIELRRSIDVLVDSETQSVTDSLLDVWQSSAQPVSGVTLAWMLRAANTADCWRKQHQQVEAVWTGPACIENLRRTDAALMEVINAAEKRLWVVTFAAYNVPPVMSALKRAAARGVEIIFIGESSTENEALTSGGVNALRQHLPGNVKIYFWPLQNRESNAKGKTGALHAKIAIADQKIALVSSANLTDYALNLNVEAGILIRGGNIAATYERQFQHMVDTGIFQSLI